MKCNLAQRLPSTFSVLHSVVEDQYSKDVGVGTAPNLNVNKEELLILISKQNFRVLKLNK